MGRRGPAPKPTARKILTGNPGKRPLNSAEPQPLQITPKCPKSLTPRAKEIWEELRPELERLGLLTCIDWVTYAPLCHVWAEFEWAMQTIEKEGHYIIVGGKQDPVTGVWHGGQAQPHPAVGILATARKDILNYSARFGLDPSSRSRIQAPGQADRPSRVEARKR